MASEIFSSKALILLASRPESVGIAVEELRPECLAVISSQAVLPAIVAKCAEFESVRFFYRMVDHPMEISDTFSKFDLALSDLEDAGYERDAILLDTTGGPSPMKIGAALAAMSSGIAMVHQRVPQNWVDGGWKRDESQPVEVMPMENPLLATGILREGQAVEMFNRRDYPAAALVFSDITEKVSGIARRHYYRGLLLLSEGYAAWDVADYDGALEKLRAAREDLGVGYSEATFAERAEVLLARISAHLPFLGKVRGPLSRENVADMLENARRRISDQGRYDDGVARLYRCVEMWHQLRLRKRHSIETGEVDWSKVDEGARGRFLEVRKLKELPAEIGLRDSRTLDRILNGEDLEEDSTFRDLLQKRNHSILAHGLDPIGGEAATKFLQYVEEMVGSGEVRSSAAHAKLRGI